MTTLPTYQELTDTLQALNSEVSASKAHGILCGLLCATLGDVQLLWEHYLYAAEEPSLAPGDSLHALYKSSEQLMNEFSLEFQLLLPDDETHTLDERSEALGLWCQGFLLGLEYDTKNKPVLSTEATEALEDLTEIAQISSEEATSTEEDEQAFIELEEYVRLAVLMLYYEYRASASTSHPEHHLLH